MATQVALVTGAGTGIGQAIAAAFARRGMAVVVVGRTAASLEATAIEVREAGGQCLAHIADVGDPAQASGCIDAAMQRFGRVDVLVNNAAQSVCAPVGELDLNQFDAMLRVNAAGVVYLCHAVWPVMERQKHGTIINISSLAADDPFPGLTTYGATKAFVNLLTKGLANEGRKHGIAVFAVAPGAVETRMLRGSFPDFPSDAALPPSAIADMVVLLTDPTCRYSAGETIRVRR